MTQDKQTREKQIESRPDGTARHEAAVPFEQAGLRLDQVLVELFPGFSRSRLQTWLKDGAILIDGAPRKPRDKMRGGEQVILIEPAPEPDPMQAQPLPLNIVYEDDTLLVIDKPAGLVVHPAAGNHDGTLMNGLLHHAPELAGIPRAGIVHRLDKETSGLLVVARTLSAHKDLVDQLQARTVSREYLAVVNGHLVAGGTIDEPMDRHPVDRKRMAVRHNGREAITHYRVEERFRAHTALRVKLETGRTHQIRVHMAYLKHPLIGDPTYGGRLRIPPDSDADFVEVLRRFPRQALHALALGLIHPDTGEECRWESPIPDDIQALMQALRVDRDAHQESRP
ncbi:MAG: 23S rRNA pseudouridine(1911/1915/1917) synthase RluD [Gammaproteobacteria bacterium]|nr:23S rRNA pseudouridine(1911/1915/1917) synthase RluD [Gammaproteobacteria bacterium]MCP5135844.1 23S rRNA pseudouridine(1911/1915/1917) synthase RluD [Gammaproteobacteria bacterium]